MPDVYLLTLVVYYYLTTDYEIFFISDTISLYSFYIKLKRFLNIKNNNMNTNAKNPTEHNTAIKIF